MAKRAVKSVSLWVFGSSIGIGTAIVMAHYWCNCLPAEITGAGVALAAQGLFGFYRRLATMEPIDRPFRRR